MEVTDSRRNRVTVSLPAELNAQVAQLAEQEEVSVSHVVRLALRKYFKAIQERAT
jgi:metal-responsive CopG/Arc/MetJ family transcriptional regulator